MAEFPALPLWTDAYIADTADLTPGQNGVYLMLLIVAWRDRDNSLPDDMAKLARSVRVGPAEFRRRYQGQVLERFWTLVESRWRNKKLDDVRGRVRRLHEQKSNAGRASARSRAKTLESNGSDSTNVATGSYSENPNNSPTSPATRTPARSGDKSLNSNDPDPTDVDLTKTKESKGRPPAGPLDSRTPMPARVRDAPTPGPLFDEPIEARAATDVWEEDAAIWRQASADVRQVNRAAWNTWIADLVLIEVTSDGVVVLKARNAFTADYLNRNMASSLRLIWCRYQADIKDVKVIP